MATLQEFEFLTQVAPPDPARGLSAAWRNAACNPYLPLATTYQGRGTCWSTFEASLRATPGARCLGARPIAPDGTAGPYVFRSYAEVGQEVRLVGEACEAAGLGRGDRIGIYGTNSPQWITTMIATSSFAGVCVPLYDSLGPSTASHIVTHSGMRAAFVQDKCLESLSAALSEASSEASGVPRADPVCLELVVVWGSGPQPLTDPEHLEQLQATQALRAHGLRVLTWGQLLEEGRGVLQQQAWMQGTTPTSTSGSLEGGGGGAAAVLRALDGWPRAPASAQDVATIMYTSGTTGVPKGAVLTHRALVSVVASQTTFMVDPWGELRLAAALQRHEQHQVQNQSRAAAKTWELQATDDEGVAESKGHGTAGPGELAPADPQGHAAAAMAASGLMQGRPRMPHEDTGQDAHSTPTPHACDARTPPARTWPRLQPDDAHLSYLPLAHIYERALVEAALAVGAAVGCWQGDVNKVQDDAHALQPGIFIGVPRVFERVREGVQRKLAKRTPIARFLFKTFYARKSKRLAAGVPTTSACKLGDALVFSKVRAALGGRLKLVVSGAAPLAADLEEFMRTTLCCLAGQGYGLTESCSATCVALPERPDMFGSVGPIQTCVDMRLAAVPELGYDAHGPTPRGELLLSGPCLFSGYYRDPEATNAVMSSDGWFRTGDVVEVAASGALRIIDRVKHMLKLSQGEYVPVEAVETALKGGASDTVAALWVYGEPGGRRLVAVAVPRKDTLVQWAHGAPEVGSALSHAAEESAEGWAALCAHPAAAQRVLSVLQSTAKSAALPRYQHPAAVHLEPVEWTVETQLLTPTHKLRRHTLKEHYQQQLAALYTTLGGN